MSDSTLIIYPDPAYERIVSSFRSHPIFCFFLFFLLVTMVGKFAAITMLMVRFLNPTLHCLAGDTLEFDAIFSNSDNDELVPDPFANLRHTISDILIANCTQTTLPACIPALIDAMTLSWQNANNDWQHLRSANKLKLALKECILLQVDNDFAFTAHCDALFFSPNSMISTLTMLAL
jgi:hypothetical protein